MKEWKEICAQQSARLERGLDLHKHAFALANHGKARSWFKNEDIEHLQDSFKQINAKINRLNNGEFHIAVVGAEKGGKSSFINAWLENDLLPNKQERCTFTTTRLHSVNDNAKQRLEIIPKNESEFEDLIRELKTLAKTDGEEGRHAKEDLEIINNFSDQMKDLVGRKPITIPFTSLEEIEEPLDRYAADPKYAHAIRQVDLYTNRLASIDGILFYDVPGIDSGLKKHVEETRKMLEDSDAVILVKRIEPNLRDSEKEILSYVQSGDKSVKLRDKLFLFFTRLDGQETPAGLQENQRKIFDECDKFGIDAQKIVFGAPPAVLLLLNRLKDTNYIKPRPELKRHIKYLLNLPDDNDETVMKVLGIAGLTEKLETYLHTERERILRESCDKLLDDLEKTARNIQTAARKYVPDNPQEYKNKHEVEVNIRFNEWFSEFWKKAKAELQNDDFNQIISDSYNQMNGSYQEIAAKKIDGLKYYRPEEISIFFDAEAAAHRAEDYEIFNGNIRAEIYKEITSVIQDLSEKLSTNLYQNLMEYIKGLSDKFNNSLDIESRLFDKMGIYNKEDYQRQLESAVGALFLHYSRPLAEGLLRYRHGLAERRNFAKTMRRTFFGLSQFYPIEQPQEYARLVEYISNSNTAPNKEADNNFANDKAAQNIYKKILKQEPGNKTQETAPAPSQNSKPQYESRNDVIAELEEDRKAFKAYMTSSIFDCSGINDYAASEMDRIRVKFLEMENTIQGMGQAALNQHNQKFMEILPPDLQNIECDTKISDLLHELTLSLQNWRKN